MKHCSGFVSMIIIVRFRCFLGSVYFCRRCGFYFVRFGLTLSVSVL